MTMLPDVDMIKTALELLLVHADEDTIYKARALYERGASKKGLAFNEDAIIGKPDFIDRVIKAAIKAARRKVPTMLAPPVATFRSDAITANEDDVVNGLALSVDLDKRPQAGLGTLISRLGPPTLLVASGGVVEDGAGKPADKLHAYYRLAKPTRTFEEHERLRDARRLAALRVDGDLTLAALSHPLRLPGSVHRKDEPRVVRILVQNPAIEINLDDAWHKLKGDGGDDKAGARDGDNHATDDPYASYYNRITRDDIIAALEVLPNDYEDRQSWIEIGMAIKAGGGEFEDFEQWSRRWHGYNEADTKRAWKSFGHIRRISAIKLRYEVRKRLPDWEWPSLGNEIPEEPEAEAKSEPELEPEPDERDVERHLAWKARKRRENREKLEAARKRSVKMEDFVCPMTAGNFIYIPAGEPWPAKSVDARLPSVDITKPEDTKPKRLRASQFIATTRAVEQVTWLPGKPAIIRDFLIDENGLRPHRNSTIFNFYRPPNVMPGDPDKADRWLDHVARVYPDNRLHIVHFLAHRVQRPWEKINHGLFLGGAPGIGKDTLLVPLEYAIGRHNFEEVSPAQFMGRFNGFYKAVILRVNEARDLGEINSYRFYDHCKSILAAPPFTITIDIKHMPTFRIPNLVGVIITSNYKNSGLFLPCNDRRHYVAWSPLKEGDLSQAYFDDLYKWYEAGGERHVAAFLRTCDISEFNPKAPPPKTEAFWEIATTNQGPEEAAVQDVVDSMRIDGIAPKTITIDQLVDKADEIGAREFAEWLRDRRHRVHIPKTLEAADYVVVRNPRAKDSLWLIDGKRQIVYARMDLTAEERWVSVCERVERKDT